MVSGVQRTLDRSTERTYQERTAGASERRVRTSRLREREKDLRETDQVSLEKYLGFFLNSGKESDLNGSSMKTLRVCLARTEDLTSCRYSVKWIGGGYDIEWQVFNSKDFGVPQNRERVYTIGHLRANGTRKIFPIQAADGENCTPIELIGHRDGYHKNLQTYSPDGITETLDTCGGGGREHHVALDWGGTQIAHTLMARDYKGIGNQDMTGVLELINPSTESQDQSQTPLRRERIGVSVNRNKLGLL